MATVDDMGFWVQRDLVVAQYATYQPFWVLELDDGTYYDTTGHTAKMQVRATADSATVIATYSTADSSILVGQTVDTYTGGIMLNLGPEDTTPALLPGGLVAGYDLYLTTPAGKVIPFSTGRFCVADAYTEVS